MPDIHSKPTTAGTPAARSWRLFVAVALPDTVKDALAGMQAQVRAALPPGSVRWVARRQLHFTLVFLGAVPLARIGALADVLESACAGLPALELSVAQLGWFAQRGRPRVIWVGVNDRQGALPRVQAMLAQATRDFAYSPLPATFAPHVTLGRCPRTSPVVAQSLAALAHQGAGREFGRWQVRGVDLLRSQLAADGSRYQRLQHFALSGA